MIDIAMSITNEYLLKLGSRWIPIVTTTNSGKQQFVCLCCGRLSPAPDKVCPSSAMIASGGTTPRRYINCENWETSTLKSWS